MVLGNGERLSAFAIYCTARPRTAAFISRGPSARHQRHAGPREKGHKTHDNSQNSNIVKSFRAGHLSLPVSGRCVKVPIDGCTINWHGTHNAYCDPHGHTQQADHSQNQTRACAEKHRDCTASNVAVNPPMLWSWVASAMLRNRSVLSETLPPQSPRNAQIASSQNPAQFC